MAETRLHIGGESTELAAVVLRIGSARIAREHLVAMRVVLLLVREVPQMAHREQGGAPLDDALETERQERQRADADGLVQGEPSLAHDVEKSQAEQPVHPPMEAGGIGRRPGVGPGAHGEIGHRRIL